MAKFFYSSTKQKALLLLATGIVLGFSHSPKAHYKIWKALPKAWREINKTTLRRIIEEFKYKRLVDFKEEKDGSVTIVLTELGRYHALRYDPDNIKISIPLRWDRKWRIVIFDIPEKKKAAREAFRRELRKLGFFELQKSVWVFPYKCEDAINFLMELFEIREYVRYLEVLALSHDADLRLHFKLIQK